MSKQQNSNNQNIRGVTHGHTNEHQSKGKMAQEVEERKDAHAQQVSERHELDEQYQKENSEHNEKDSES